MTSSRFLRPNFDAIAFDLDGTLVDTAADIARALNAALAAEGLAPAAEADVRGWIGDGPERLARRALAHRGVEADEALVARLRAAFHAATLAAPLVHGRVYEGIVPLLRTWRPRVRIVVVTNKPTDLSRQVLDAAGLAAYFGAVYGGDDPATRKPAPGLLLAAAAGCGVPPGRLLLVGDSANDAHAARAAGCGYAWASWGYGVLPGSAEGAIARLAHPSDVDTVLALPATV